VSQNIVDEAANQWRQRLHARENMIIC